jgi:hypothetical protein
MMSFLDKHSSMIFSGLYKRHCQQANEGHLYFTIRYKNFST